jgi:uncharacterized membrane protein
MSVSWMIHFVIAAVIAYGLVAGVFFTFSDFVMRSLKAVTPTNGIAAMQSINRRVYGSVFLALFLGLAAVSVGLAVGAIVFGAGAATAWIVAGGATYLGGVFLVTVVFNVPMNKRLDSMNPVADGTAHYWSHYVTVWTRWNHVRTAASAAATLLLLVGVVELAAG